MIYLRAIMHGLADLFERLIVGAVYGAGGMVGASFAFDLLKTLMGAVE